MWDFRCLALLGHLWNAPPLKAQGSLWKRCIKIVRARGIGWLQKTLFSGHNRIVAYMNLTSLLAACTALVHGQIPAEWVGRHGVPPLSKELLVIDGCCKRGILLSSRMWPLRSYSYSSRWPYTLVILSVLSVLGGFKEHTKLRGDSGGVRE